MNWTDLLQALGLVLIFEGLMPFLNPGGARRAMLLVAKAGDGVLRAGGLAALLSGAFLLFVLGT